MGRGAGLAVLRQSRSSPRGVVLIGTNNEATRDAKQAGDRGVLMAFREATGEFMWQATFEKLASGRANDWPFQGIASSPLVEKGVAYFVTNRGQVIAADLDGFHDKTNDGAVKDEKLTGTNDPDFIWIFDMMEEVGAVSAQPLQLVAGVVSEPDLRQHRRTVRTRATSTFRHRRRRRSSRSTRRPESSSGKTTRSRTAFSTGSGRRRRSATSAASCRWCTRRATAGSAATRR